MNKYMYILTLYKRRFNKLKENIKLKMKLNK